MTLALYFRGLEFAPLAGVYSVGWSLHRQAGVCTNGLEFAFANHASRFGRVGSYRNSYQINVTGAHGFVIQQLAIETAGPGQTTPENVWQKTLADISDPRNLSFADISYWVVEGNVGPVATFTKIGGANMHARRIGSTTTCTP